MTSRSLVPTGTRRRFSETSQKGERLQALAGVVSARLICISGPAARTEFALEERREWVVGRARDGGISIDDTSVSRRHLALRRLAGEWLARDLGSGNGTIVNGRRLLEEIRLRDGDVLSLGDTKLEFIDPSEPRTLIEKRPSLFASFFHLSLRQKRLVLAAVSTAGLLGMVGVGSDWRRSQKERQLLQEKAASTRRRMEELFQRGKNLVRQGSWTAAKSKFLEIEHGDPNFPDVREYLELIKKEIPNQEQLVKAEMALNQNQLGEASDALTKVSNDTMQHAKVAAVRTALEDKITVRLSEARSALVVEDYDSVRKLALDILRAAPENSDAKQLLNAAQNAWAGQAKRERPAPVARTGPWQTAIDRFLEGDLPGAILILDRCAAKRIRRCKLLASKMRDFDELQKRVDYLDAEGLRRLIALDLQLNQGKESWWSDKAKWRLGATLYKVAAKAQTDHDWSRAAKMAREALRVDPNHPSAANLLQDLKTKAKDVYLSAYTLRETDPGAALAKFKEVLQMISPSEEDYQKAKSWVEKLSK